MHYNHHHHFTPRVTMFLQQLAVECPTPQDVRQWLVTRNITGTPRCSTTCPIAKAIYIFTGQRIEVGNSAVHLDTSDTYVPFVELPQVIKEFITWYDF